MSEKLKTGSRFRATCSRFSIPHVRGARNRFPLPGAIPYRASSTAETGASDTAADFGPSAQLNSAVTVSG